jgi:hypothetical protein
MIEYNNEIFFFFEARGGWGGGVRKTQLCACFNDQCSLFLHFCGSELMTLWNSKSECYSNINKQKDYFPLGLFTPLNLFLEVLLRNVSTIANINA